MITYIIEGLKEVFVMFAIGVLLDKSKTYNYTEEDLYLRKNTKNRRSFAFK